MKSNNLELRRPQGKRSIIKTALLKMIAEQGLEFGEQIPGQIELALYFKTTVVTIHRALVELESEKFIHRINGSGTFVGPKPVSGRTRNLCLVLPGEHLDDPADNPDFWPYVRQLMHAFLSVAGTEWRFASVGATSGMGMPVSMEGLGRDDVVFFHHIKEPREILAQLVREGKVYTIAFGLPDPEIRCLTIDHDPFTGMRKAVGYLAGLGYRRIAFAGSDEVWGKAWVDGYRQGLKDFGLRCDEKRMVLSGSTTQSAGMQGAEVLVQRGLPCDVILTDSDMRALGVLEYLRQEGVKVPEDVGVMGYDGLDNATQQPPFLTTLRVPFDQMIRAALAEAEASRTVRSPDKHLKFVGEVIPGQTVRKING